MRVIKTSDDNPARTDHMTSLGCLVTTVRDATGLDEHITLSCPGEWKVEIIDSKPKPIEGRCWPQR